MEYSDVIDQTTLDRAVAIARALRRTEDGSVSELAATAVMQTYSTTVTGAEDSAEHKFSTVHRALVEEVAAAVQAAEVAPAARLSGGVRKGLADPPPAAVASTPGVQALSRWDNEGGAIARPGHGFVGPTR